MNNSFIDDIKNILAAARQKTYAAVNSVMVLAYWEIGKRIVEEDQHGKERATYGDALLKELSISLSRELGKGFSYANLKNFKQFYITFPDMGKSYALRSFLTWTHYRLIINPRYSAEVKYIFLRAMPGTLNSCYKRLVNGY